VESYQLLAFSPLICHHFVKMFNPFLTMVSLIGEGRVDLIVRFPFFLPYLLGFLWLINLKWGMNRKKRSRLSRRMERGKPLFA
jgi:hypothetical protein